MIQESLINDLANIEYRNSFEQIIKLSKQYPKRAFIFGRSDDLLLFVCNGTVDEYNLFSDSKVLFDKNGFISDDNDIDNDEDMEEYLKRKKLAQSVNVELFKNDRTIDVFCVYDGIGFDINETLSDGVEVYGKGVAISI